MSFVICCSSLSSCFFVRLFVCFLDGSFFITKVQHTGRGTEEHAGLGGDSGFETSNKSLIQHLLASAFQTSAGCLQHNGFDSHETNRYIMKMQ